jgi:hypothetical protein
MRDLGHPSILTEDVLGVPKETAVPLASARDDEGEGNRPTESGPRLAGTPCRTETFFITFGGRGPMTTPTG